MLDTRAKTIVVVSAVLGFLATLMVILRFWARYLKRQKFGIDDVLLIVALCLTLGVVTIDIITATWARVGEHEITVPSGPAKGDPLPWEIKRESITLWSIEILHTCAMPAIKAYTLAFYLRIFHVSRGFRTSVYVMGAYVFCWWISVLLVTIFQCLPVGPVHTLDSKCIDVLKFFRVAAVTNVISDVIIILMPIPVVLKLQLPIGQKIAVVAIFCTSSLVIVAGIGRTVAYFSVAHNLDFSYHDYYTIIWTSIEPCMGVIGACLPSLRPIFLGFSPESLVGSIRSVLSLRSMGSRDSRGRSKKDSQRLREPSESVDGASGKSFENIHDKFPSEGLSQVQHMDRVVELDERGQVIDV
ncbi:uncharacterized protein LY89DRAFT_683928 [Mollisia scopiformis]|uniref:Rhodopsin domain-containing protein n=1 Tax=Mollisia scopiformis TaxID=149040 RepID=A0A194XCR5_MOLSC|nr:uncharacterized protein LY89DRAFT_683928 [Mollisia scopiformis]KUJ17954.1 hypothetical protein LY89DRAFT_683928 [Mollisia scopiformis]